jgi:4-amino-4-deoxy-L-arabinose transferase-like glycosyltransferase
MEKQLSRLAAFFTSLSDRQVIWLAILLCFPAFLIHLDTIAFIGDEGIRSLVAFEMKHSGDFIVPTLNGAPYYNKPPLYNWFIYLTSELFGYYGEWPARVTTLFFLAAFGYTVYFFIRKEYDRLTAVTMGLMVLTSGRILFWDSMLGLIDICFSWVVYVNFMVLYFLGKEGKWKQMFVLSYLLFSAAFLMKGLPALVFQGISIISALALHGELKEKFFSPDHILGGLVGIIPVVAYYLAYAKRVSLDHVFGVLFDQSMQRTATHHGMGETILHVFTFPFEQVYHFLPWSLLIVMVFHRGFRSWMKSHEFIRFNFWLLLANLPVYWLSVQVFPRYVLMFIPLFNMVGFSLYFQGKQEPGILWKVVRVSFLVMAGLALIGCFLLPIAPQVRTIPQLYFVWIFASIGLAIGFTGMLKDGRRSFLWFVICLLVVRIVFNMVVLPLRSEGHAVNEIREDCRRVAAAHGDVTWYLFGATFPHEVARFYTSAYTNQIIKKTNEVLDEKALYLVDRNQYPDFPGVMIDSLRTEKAQVLALMRPN